MLKLTFNLNFRLKTFIYRLVALMMQTRFNLISLLFTPDVYNVGVHRVNTWTLPVPNCSESSPHPVFLIFTFFCLI